MADDVAMNFRRGRTKQQEAAPAPAAGISTLWLVLVAAAVGFAGSMVAFDGLSLSSLDIPARIAGWRAAVARPAPGETGPRVMSLVPGVREHDGSPLGLGIGRAEPLSLTYAPVGPVVLRHRSGYVEIEGASLKPPPIGPRRSLQAVMDHGALLANELRALTYTPCDRHLRYVAAANINLFVGGFMPPRTPVQNSAAADAAFWRRPEASAVRRTVAQLAERGALLPGDFGLDTSPQARGLFEGMTLGRPACD